MPKTMLTINSYWDKDLSQNSVNNLNSLLDLPTPWIPGMRILTSLLLCFQIFTSVAGLRSLWNGISELIIQTCPLICQDNHNRCTSINHQKLKKQPECKNYVAS